MREIKASDITGAVAGLCRQACYELGEDVLTALGSARQAEESPLGREALDQIIENAAIARHGATPLCQDCGAAIVFLEVGQEVHIVGGGLNAAVAAGVRRGYRENYLRSSMVEKPLTERRNTGDNTPPVIHTEIIPGDKLKISLMAKGGGAENMSRLAMLPPAAGRQGIIDLVTDTVAAAGGKSCPPLIIGLGIGATAEKAMLEAKKALLRPVGQPNDDPAVAALEKEVLAAVNSLGIGPMGYGGSVTALAVHATVMPSHMASLSVAVNLQCHSARHREAVL
jgi:fumarate hydratase subunit alpha